MQMPSPKLAFMKTPFYLTSLIKMAGIVQSILAHIVMSFKKDTKTCVCSWCSMLDPILLVYFKKSFLLFAVYIWFIGVITENMLILTLFPVLDNVLILSLGPFPKDLTSYFLCEALNE